MADLAGRGPLGQKRGHRGKGNPTYLDEVRRLPCAACEAGKEHQTSPTTAHHPICGRYEGRKAPDEDAIPLCHDHHQGDNGSPKVAIHKDKTAWVELYGPDTRFIAQTQHELARFRKKARK